VFIFSYSSGQVVYIFGQQDVDEFPQDYPGVIEVDRINIKNGVFNLKGLEQLEKVGSIEIYNTELENLEGLENLKEINWLVIRENDNLESIEHLSNDISIFKINIRENEKLTNCSLDVFCKMLAEYRDFYFADNGNQCQGRKTFEANCNFESDSIQRPILFQDDFEEWEDGLPKNWESDLLFNPDSNIPNIEEAVSLSLNEKSILLRNSFPYEEGLLTTIISYSPDEILSEFDISFYYKCIGDGSCAIHLIEKGDSISINGKRRTIWRERAIDTLTHFVELKRIKSCYPNSYFEDIQFRSIPRIYNPCCTEGSTEFIIDQVIIRREITSSLDDQQANSLVKIYPNPANSHLTIDSNEEILKIELFNLKGELLKVIPKDTQMISFENFSSGMLVLRLTFEDGIHTELVSLLKQH